jgi:hypothetical protein
LIATAFFCLFAVFGLDRCCWHCRTRFSTCTISTQFQSTTNRLSPPPLLQFQIWAPISSSLLGLSGWAIDVSGKLLQVKSEQSTYTSRTDCVRADPTATGINGRSRHHQHSNNTSHYINTMSHHNLLTSDIPEMDDAASMDTPLSNPAGPTRASTTTSGRGRGRGRWARVKNARVTKTAQPRASAGRGRRQKVYDSLKIQAAHERAQELKQAFAAVGKLVKPAVQEIADRSINELLEDPAAFEMVPEYATTKTFLRKRRDDTIKLEDVRLKHRLAMIEHVYKAECQKAHEAYTVSVTSPSTLCCHLGPVD